MDWCWLIHPFTLDQSFNQSVPATVSKQLHTVDESNLWCQRRNCWVCLDRQAQYRCNGRYVNIHLSVFDAVLSTVCGGIKDVWCVVSKKREILLMKSGRCGVASWWVGKGHVWRHQSNNWSLRDLRMESRLKAIQSRMILFSNVLAIRTRFEEILKQIRWSLLR